MQTVPRRPDATEPKRPTARPEADHFVPASIPFPSPAETARWTKPCERCGSTRSAGHSNQHQAVLCASCFFAPERRIEESKEQEQLLPPPSLNDVVQAPVPVPVPSIGAKSGNVDLEERADLRVLLDAYEGAPVELLPLPELPGWATPVTHRVLQDMALCSGLLRAAGDDGTVIYAVDWAAARLGLSSSTVSVALRALRHCGAIRVSKVLPSMGDGRAGSRVYALVLPAEPVSVEGLAEDVDAAPVSPEGEIP